MNLKINMRAIQLFEQMTECPFTEIEQHPELMNHMLYCTMLAHPENDLGLTFEEAQAGILKCLPELIAGFTRDINIASQFAHVLSDTEILVPDSSTAKKPEKVYVSSVIPMLVCECGLDINYVLNEMPYSDVDMWTRYIIKKKQDEMEDKRFWTYLTISPHIDHKKCKSAKDLVEFQWEKAAKKAKFEKEQAMIKERLRRFGILKDSSTGETTKA